MLTLICFSFPFQGKLLTEVRAVTRRQSSAVTAMSTDVDCNYVVSGDSSTSSVNVVQY